MEYRIKLTRDKETQEFVSNCGSAAEMIGKVVSGKFKIKHVDGNKTKVEPFLSKGEWTIAKLTSHLGGINYDEMEGKKV